MTLIQQKEGKDRGLLNDDGGERVLREKDLNKKSGESEYLGGEEKKKGGSWFERGAGGRRDFWILFNETLSET